MRAFLLLGFCLMAAPGVLFCEEQSEPVDWLVMISRLRQQMQDHPGRAETRRQLATAYNNYAVALIDKGESQLAIEQLQTALDLDEHNSDFRENLGRLYVRLAHDAYQLHQLEEALKSLNQAIALSPKIPEAYILKGDVEYQSQKLKEAKASWQQALTLQPDQSEIVKRLEQVQQEIPVESKFERLSQAYFDLRYEEQLERPIGFDIRDALLEARRTVGADFAYWPKHKLIVLIYSAESFHSMRQDTPEWVAGQFDGKIRVPLPSVDLKPLLVEKTIFHEYTHALIHDLTQGKCPRWLDEGLAEYEGRKQYSEPLHFLKDVYQKNNLIPWTELSDHIAPMMARDEVGLAYEQSWSIASYLVERYGFWRIRRLLKAIGEGESWEQVMAKEFRSKLPKLESAWREWLPQFMSGVSP
ncbi:MAG: tetratricopeptide repeat protein [Candidatus Omnitrophica bacterium]|nr:tetratricopeptide repeat protein [Candidatus Omnitrophota bacterium]